MTLFEKYNENERFNYNTVIENVCIWDCEYLDGHFDVKASKSICSKIGITEEKCEKCWNLNYIEDYVTDTNVGNKNEITLQKAITAIGKYCNSKKHCNNCPCFNKGFGCVLGEVPISDHYEDLLSYLGEEPIPLEFEE